MADPDLRFLGERIERIQAGLRELRGVKADVAQLRAELRAAVAELRAEMSRLDLSVAERADRIYSEMDTRFSQVSEMMASNLAVLLEAIRGPRAIEAALNP